MPEPSRSHYQTLISISEAEGDIELLIRNDALKVRMNAIRGAGEHPLTRRIIHRLLDSKKIKHGRLDAAIDEALATLNHPFARVDDVLIAEASPPQHGQDGQLEALYDADHPWVEADQPVARRLPPSTGTPGRDVFGSSVAAGPGRELDVRCGEGIRHDREHDLYIAEKPGWAAVAGRCVALSSRFCVAILDRGFEARASFDEPAFESQELLTYLDQLGIIHGLELRAIEDAAAAGRAEQLLVARGQHADPGEHARVEYHFARRGEPPPPQARDSNPLAMFDPGETLLRLTPARQGKPGKTIFGIDLPVEPVHDMAIEAGDNVEVLDQEGVLVFTALMRGAPMLEKNLLSVRDHLVIKGDLTPEHGNIHFEGRISIGGNIPNGYRVETGGDLNVRGVINEATLKVAGDLQVDSGFMGGLAEVGGDLSAKYIDNARLRVGGTIRVANEIIGARIDCLGHIEAPRAVMRGGLVRALRGMTLNVIGSDSRELRTDLIAGEDIRLIEAEQDILPQLQLLQDEQKNLNRKVQQLVPTQDRVRHLSDSQRTEVRQLLQRLSEVSKQIKALDEELDAVKDRAEAEAEAFVQVNKCVHAGSRLAIASSSSEVSREIIGPAHLVDRDGQMVIERD